MKQLGDKTIISARQNNFLSLICRTYGFFGLFLILFAILAATRDIPYFNIWVTPIGWFGYIFFLDWMVFKIKNQSLILSRTKEFLWMLPISVLLWCLFEWHNLYFKNWEYLGIPETWWLKYPGLFLAFSTILPAMIETNEWLKAQRVISFDFTLKDLKKPSTLHLTLEIMFGILLILICCLWANEYTGPLVWIGYLFVFAPLNYLLGIGGILRDRGEGNIRETITLCLTGVICGIVWEFLNFWADAKWVYHVPYFENIRVFEMPLLGFLGFIPFAILFLEMYSFLLKGVIPFFGEKFFSIRHPA